MRIWTHSVQILDMVRILQLEVHPFFQVAIVHFTLESRFPNSYSSNLETLSFIINSVTTVSVFSPCTTTKILYSLLPSSDLRINISGTNPLLKSTLPRPGEFEKALYTFDIGQNDLAYGFQHTSEAETLASIPKILDGFSQAVLVSHRDLIIIQGIMRRVSEFLQILITATP